MHDLLPWALTITTGASPYGVSTIVTVGHLLNTIHSELHRQIFESDFWNDGELAHCSRSFRLKFDMFIIAADVGEDDRQRIHRAWSVRSSVLAEVNCGEEMSLEREAKCREIANEGVKRVDFLGERTLFYGLKRKSVPGGGEVWEMRMRKIEV